MYKIKRFSKLAVVKEVWGNAKLQAKKYPLTVAMLGLSATNAVGSHKSRRKIKKKKS